MRSFRLIIEKKKKTPAKPHQKKNRNKTKAFFFFFASHFYSSLNLKPCSVTFVLYGIGNTFIKHRV